jgi:glutamate-1-semialdehyde 2,1-aminomutase
MVRSIQNSRKLQKRAKTVLPLGVNSNFRYWGEKITPYYKKAKGAYIWDVDDNRYIDYRMAFGPIILGHAYEEVNNKVIEEIDKGVLCAMTNELEIEVAERIIALCPAIEMVRLACSGTEATMHAIRVARAFTGRDLILKFEGMYHGFHDYTLFSTYAPISSLGNINSPISIPASSGIPKTINNLILTIPFNDFDVLEKTIKNHGTQIAAIISEPCMGNCAAIKPEKGYLEYIRKQCDDYGIVFILDEVKTGFRLANGGAQEYFGIIPDLTTYAKSLGNGYPIAAFGGKKEIMEIIGHGVAQGGTYNNNVCGVAAAYQTLEILSTQPIIETINRRGQRLMEGLEKIFMQAGIKACINGYPGMFSFAIGEEKITNQREWSRCDGELYLRIVEAALDKGIMPDYDPREPWFLCYSHTDQMIDETLNVMQDVIKTVL